MKELILDNPPRSRRKRSKLGKRRPLSTRTMKKTTRRKATRRKSSRRRSLHLIRGVKLNPLTGSVFNKDNLTIAAGAVGATVVSNYALGAMGGRFGSLNPYGRAAFNVGIPVLAGLIVKRMSPNLAKGMLIGGLANGIGQLVTASGLLPAGTTAPVQTASTTTAQAATVPAITGPATTSEYLGEYLGANIGVDRLSTGTDNNQAFGSAW